jgi:hypothetical protein
MNTNNLRTTIYDLTMAQTIETFPGREIFVYDGYMYTSMNVFQNYSMIMTIVILWVLKRNGASFKHDVS